VIRKGASGLENPGVATSLHGLAVSCGGRGKYDDAGHYFEQVLRIREKTYGQVHEDVAEVLASWGNLYRDQLMIVKAESLLVRAVDIYETVNGPDHKTVGHVLTMLAVATGAQMRLSEADSILLHAKRILEKQLGPDHPDMSSLIAAQGYFLVTQGRISEADSLARRALTICENSRGENHIEVARRLFVVGFVTVIQGKYSEAKAYFTRALTITETAVGPEHPQTGRMLNTVANIYRQLGKHDLADSLHQRSLEIVEQSYGRVSMDAAESILNMAVSALTRGRYAEAESLYVECLDIFEQTFGLEHPDVAVVISSFGALYYSQGRYAEAEQLFERALEICHRSAGTGQLQVGATILNIANLRVAQGRYEESETMYTQALDILKNALGEEHPHVAQCFQNLAIVNLRTMNYRGADTLARRSLALLESTRGHEHEEVAGILNVLGTIALRQGRYDESASLFNRSLAIWDKTLGSDHPNAAVNLDNLAEVHAYQDDYDEAERLHEKALAVRTKALGTEHPLVAEGLETYSTLLRLKGNWTEALLRSRMAFDIRRNNFEDNGHSLAETDALLFSQKVRLSADRLISCYFDSENIDADERKKTSDVILSSKGQVSDMIFERRKPLVAEADPAALALADSLRDVQFQLSALFVSGPGNDTTSQYYNQLDSLQNLSDEIETDLAILSASFRKHQERKEINTDRVMSLLPENSVLVEYFKYDHFIPLADSVEPRYAVAIQSRDSSPQIISLGRASEIEKSIDIYRRHMLGVSSLRDGPGIFDLEDYQVACSPLYESIWKPVEDYVADKDLVLIAPDGGLNMIPFAGLPGKDGKYLVEDYTLHYLSSGRDLIRLTDEVNPTSGLFALGDPDYDALSVDKLSGSVEGENRIRNVRPSCGELMNLSVSPLPGTRREVEQLISSWQDDTDESVTAYYGSNASEENFKSDAPGHRIIHLATHGYFLEGSCNPDIPSASYSSAPVFAGENPLLLSGLLLSGSNRVGSNSVDVRIEDGILTAYEVSSMDMAGTELVVLSACETGLGEVKSGEGVYGLRRAFQMAGARTVVSALWPVSDQSTAEMMSRLYEKIEESLPERMQRMQLEKITKLRGNNQPDHPFSWGGFIVLGDWR